MMSFREKVNNLKSLEQCRQQDRFFTELTNFPKANKNQVFLLNNRSVKENEQNRLKIKDSFMNERNQSLLNV